MKVIEAFVHGIQEALFFIAVRWSVVIFWHQCARSKNIILLDQITWELNMLITQINQYKFLSSNQISESSSYFFYGFLKEMG